MTFRLLISAVLITQWLVSCQQTEDDNWNKALMHGRKKEYDKAIVEYNKLLKRNDKLQLAYYNRGFAYAAEKQYEKALLDFNKVISLQSNGNLIITYNKDSTLADEEASTKVPVNDALYQRAQAKYFLDSLRSSFNDFQNLVDNNYEEMSNCILWQGIISVKSGSRDQACSYFDKAGKLANNIDDKKEAENMMQTYCAHPINSH